jgi:hypothetical protein
MGCQCFLLYEVRLMVRKKKDFSYNAVFFYVRIVPVTLSNMNSEYDFKVYFILK